MDNTPLIQRDFLVYFNGVDAQGKPKRFLELFGFELIQARDVEAVEVKRSLHLSLYQAMVVKDFDMNAPFETETQKMHSIPLLAKLLGEEITAEVEVPGSRRTHYMYGKKYSISEWLRYTAYRNTSRWFTHNKKRVYLVESADDHELLPYTFGNDDWHASRPSNNYIINVAHEAYHLVKGL